MDTEGLFFSLGLLEYTTGTKEMLEGKRLKVLYAEKNRKAALILHNIVDNVMIKSKFCILNIPVVSLALKIALHPFLLVIQTSQVVAKRLKEKRILIIR